MHNVSKGNESVSTDGLPSTLDTLTDIKTLALSPLYNSFCISNTNVCVDELNDHSASFVGKQYAVPRTHLLAQEEVCKDCEDTMLATPEKMADYDDHSVPVHDLYLFRGARVSLLRNIALSRAMANGSTFIVMEIGRHVIKLMNVTHGDFYGSIEMIFRVRLKVTLKGSFSFSRLQFPLRMAHAGSAHKFQGQTCAHPARVLYDIRTPPFCHGQSYVGLSRAQKSPQVILLSLPEFGRCMPCLIYPQLTHWNSGVSMVPFKSIHVGTSSHDSEESQDNNSDESTFEEQNFHVDDDPCQRPEEHSDIFNSINEDMKMRAVKAIKSLKKNTFLTRHFLFRFICFRRESYSG